MVTPTYYVYFTTTTIITSAVLFRGFRGSPSQIVSIVMGFLTICSGVVLLQLSKSAKDVPDTAVFSGNLDQIHTIADQEQPETEPKADSIRGTAAILRRISTVRQRMEMEELRRLRQEKQMEQQELHLSGQDGPVYEWDGLRRRKTGRFGSQSTRARSGTNASSLFTLPRTPEMHPPLGMTHFPTDQDRNDEQDRNRPTSPGVLSSIGGTIRTRAKSFLSSTQAKYSAHPTQQSPHHPVALTEMEMARHSTRAGGYLQPGVDHHDFIDTGYAGARGVHNERTNSQRSDFSFSSSHLAPTPPPHTTRRMFSFQSMFRRGQHPTVPEEDYPDEYHRPSHPVSRSGLGSRGQYAPQVRHATEEERLGLVERDPRFTSPPGLRDDVQENDGMGDSDFDSDDDKYPRPAPESSSPPRYQESVYDDGFTGSPPRRGVGDEKLEYESPRGRPHTFGGRGHDSPSPSPSPPPPPPHRTLRMRPGGDGSLL